MTIDKKLLASAFPPECLRTRQGAGNQTFTYVDAEDVISRLLEATEGEYTWEVLKLDYVEPVSITGKQGTRVRPAYWMVQGRLTIPGLGSRDGVGTANDENEDSPKAGETDALKRCAVKFAVALQLYAKPPQAPVRGQQVNTGNITPKRVDPTQNAPQSQEKALQDTAPEPVDYQKRFYNLCLKFHISTKAKAEECRGNILPGQGSRQGVYSEACKLLRPVYEAMKSQGVEYTPAGIVSVTSEAIGTDILGMWELTKYEWDAMHAYWQSGCMIDQAYLDRKKASKSADSV